MADTGDGDGKKQGLPKFSSQEKGNRNKRKFLPEISQDPLSNTYSLTEFPKIEVLEAKYKHVKGILESMGDMSEKGKVEDLDLSKCPEWKDPMIPAIEELIIKKLSETYHDAIKKVVEHGYDEKMAECAVVRGGPYFGKKGLLSNIVEGALEYLRGDHKEVETLKEHMFDNLKDLIEYTMLEMTFVIKEVDPTLSVVDAMWCVLLFNLDLQYACSVKDLHKFLMEEEEVKGESSSEPKKSDNVVPVSGESSSEAKKSDDVVPVSGSQVAGEVQKNEKEFGVQAKGGKGKAKAETRENIRAAVEAALMEGIDKKGGPAGISKRDLLRSKQYLFEKNVAAIHGRMNQGRMSKGSFKAKVTSLGGPSDAAVSAKNSLTQSNEAKSKSQMPVPVPVPVPQEKEKSTQNAKVNAPSPPKTAEQYRAGAGIPYDKAQGKYIARDTKDEIILAAAARMEGLQKELEMWDEWANKKVMQVARRLRKDQAELKTLRLEKEEFDKIKKEKQTLEESTVKRLSEMENALTSATGQVALADSTARKLKVENSALQEKMMDADKKAYQESLKLDEAILKEEETLKKCQLIGTEKAALQEEFTALKGKASALQKGLEKPKTLVKQFEAQRAYEEREKNKFLNHIEKTRKEKEHNEAVAKAEVELMEEYAKKETEKYKEEMRKMEEKISILKLETEARKIAELRKSANLQPYRPKESKRLPVFRNFFAGETSGDLKREHECVMCMSKEMSVIFLPCAHQVLCVDCNVIHEKQGMKECPSCRTLIHKRFIARFAP